MQGDRLTDDALHTPPWTNPLTGVTFHARPWMVVKVERRVRGGYMNHWLIRQVVEKPAPYCYVGSGGRDVYAHPIMIERAKAALVEEVRRGRL